MTNEDFIKLWRSGQAKSRHKDLDDSYRHGNYVYEVFELPDGSFWACNYAISGNGEEHGIRDNEFDLYQVTPVEKIISTIEYVPVT